MTTKTCNGCGQTFDCGADSSNPCWCATVPPISTNPNPAFDCFCPECLAGQVSEAGASEQPPLVENGDFYFEDGLLVMTALYHIKRGSCCGSRCRWCPFDPKYELGATKLAAKSLI